ncbi:protein of unknown function [Candidatus Methylomirabilis oxygeniifera]|uniref:Uncharacterized protein n=1 Tax=Methylomirabilis oxygeniifera TaxID=671143 RepID=D5MM61_METO1|nr:protein of unknown function [Candidatus Methylomirabilis oxyfera]
MCLITYYQHRDHKFLGEYFVAGLRLACSLYFWSLQTTQHSARGRAADVGARLVDLSTGGERATARTIFPNLLIGDMEVSNEDTADLDR